MKESIANAFAYDPAYAVSWVEIPDGPMAIGARILLMNFGTASSPAQSRTRSGPSGRRLGSRTMLSDRTRDG